LFLAPEWHQHPASGHTLALIGRQVVEETGQWRIDRDPEYGSGGHGKVALTIETQLLSINTITYNYTRGAARTLDVT
jgi:hypothetical protein